MALKLEWTAFEDASGAFACAGGLRLLAGKDGRWSVIALGNVDVTSHAPTLAAAQEAAEAAAARLLAEDAGVLALLGLRWIPVGEALPQEYSPATWSGDRVLVCFRNGHMASHAWAPSKYHALGVWVTRAGSTSAVDDGDHWRPLGDGPEVKS
jgi:hypothetical protein